MKWTITKRRDSDYLIHREGERRGICTTWEQGHAVRIAAALNTLGWTGESGEKESTNG